MQQGWLVVGCIVFVMAGVYCYFLLYLDSIDHDSSEFHLLTWAWDGVYYALFEFEHRFKWLILATMAGGWAAAVWMVSLLTGDALSIPQRASK